MSKVAPSAVKREHYATRYKRQISDLQTLKRVLMKKLQSDMSKVSEQPAQHEGMPRDPNDTDDEGDDKDPDEPTLPSDDIPDNSFKVLIRFTDEEHLFKMDIGEQSVEELKFAVMGRLNIPWFQMELTPFGADQPLMDDVFIEDPIYYLEGALEGDENENSIDPFAPFNVGFDLEVDDDHFPRHTLKNLNVIQHHQL